MHAQLVMEDTTDGPDSRVTAMTECVLKFYNLYTHCSVYWQIPARLCVLSVAIILL